ncbi:MAG: M28 family peptidase [Betaproteobacteria bacterium]|nr:M28 family peptidase [Betaproteobacteria bacterium]
MVIPGAARPEEIVLVGAHYDTVEGSPGADDNASGVADDPVVADACLKLFREKGYAIPA